MVQPLPQPPLRHSKSLQIAPDAQPAALLLVDVLTASHVATVETPNAEQQQAADVQEMQQVICVLAFEDASNQARTGEARGSCRSLLTKASANHDAKQQQEQSKVMYVVWCAAFTCE